MHGWPNECNMPVPTEAKQNAQPAASHLVVVYMMSHACSIAVQPSIHDRAISAAATTACAWLASWLSREGYYDECTATRHVRHCRMSATGTLPAHDPQITHHTHGQNSSSGDVAVRRAQPFAAESPGRPFSRSCRWSALVCLSNGASGACECLRLAGILAACHCRANPTTQP
jgi:hypothetical protein